MMRPALVALVTAMCLHVAAPAEAQEPSASEVALARRLYREGLRAARREHWEEARDAFSRSLSLADRPATRLNLATAQLQTGELVAAAENYRFYLANATRARLRQRAQTALDALEPRIPSIVLRIENRADTDQVLLDGEELAAAAVGEPLPVDPGEHTLEVQRDGSAIATEQISLEEGENREVSMRVPRAPSPREVALASQEGAGTSGEDGGSLTSSPVFWAVSGGVAVAVAVVVIVVLASGGDELGPHYDGNLGSVPVR